MPSMTWLAEQRQRAGGLEHVVAVLGEERFVEVERIARGGLARADVELGGAFFQRFVVDRVLAAAVGERAVAVIEVDVIAGAEPVAKAGVLLAEHVLHVKA